MNRRDLLKSVDVLPEGRVCIRVVDLALAELLFRDGDAEGALIISVEQGEADAASALLVSAQGSDL